jgi:hypothetical protein
MGVWECGSVGVWERGSLPRSEARVWGWKSAWLQGVHPVHSVHLVHLPSARYRKRYTNSVALPSGTAAGPDAKGRVGRCRQRCLHPAGPPGNARLRRVPLGASCLHPAGPADRERVWVTDYALRITP